MIIESFSIDTEYGREIFTLDKNVDGFGYVSADGDDVGIRETTKEDASRAAAASYESKAWAFEVEYFEGE